MKRQITCVYITIHIVDWSHKKLYKELLLETKAELDLVEAWTNFETVILEDFVGQSNGLDKGLNITV